MMGGREGPQANFAYQGSLIVPRKRLALASRCAQSLAGSRIWDMWAQYKLGNEFQSLTSVDPQSIIPL